MVPLQGPIRGNVAVKRNYEMKSRIRLTLRMLMVTIGVVALVVQVLTSNLEIRRLVVENTLLKKRLSELLPLSYEQVASQFVEQVEKEIDSEVEVVSIRYDSRSDHYTIRFAYFLPITRQRAETAVTAERIGLGNYHAKIRQLLLAPEKVVAVTLHVQPPHFNSNS
jgi:hypothetical protein